MIKARKAIYPPGVSLNEYVYAYSDSEKELVSLIEKSGNKKNFTREYKNRIRWLIDAKDDCYSRSAWFERLKNDKYKMLYSMKFKDKQNIRILFVFINGNRKTPLLLCAFQERNSKDYNNAIQTVHRRIDALISSGQIKREEILCHK